MKKYIISLDQGTTSSRAIIFDNEQNIIKMAQCEFEQIFPKPGLVEHNPLDIYTSQINVLNEVIEKSMIDARDIAALGITNQRETTILWDKNTGKPIHNAIVWQCRRTKDICEKLEKEGYSDYIKKATGLRIDAYFSGTKIKWILDNVKGAREKAQKGEILFGTVDTWLLWKLTNGKVHKTDFTNASRTMLFNINTLKWDDKILEVLDIPKEILPKVCESSSIFGYTEIHGEKIPIGAMVGDQQGALFGQGCFKKGDIKNTYGTGCFLLLNTGSDIVESQNGLVSTIACGQDGKMCYALEGSVFIGGALIKWLRDGIKIIKSARECDVLASKAYDNGGVYIVPAFTGLGAPYWNMDVYGSILGITRGTNRKHIAKATLEAIAFECYDLIKAMKNDTNINLTELKVDGGASVSDPLLQFQSDILKIDIKRPIIRETTALGACYLAGLATGVWKSTQEIENLWRIDKVYKSQMEDDKVDFYIEKWHKAIKATTMF